MFPSFCLWWHCGDGIFKAPKVIFQLGLLSLSTFKTSSLLLSTTFSKTDLITLVAAPQPSSFAIRDAHIFFGYCLLLPQLVELSDRSTAQQDGSLCWTDMVRKVGNVPSQRSALPALCLPTLHRCALKTSTRQKGKTWPRREWANHPQERIDCKGNKLTTWCQDNNWKAQATFLVKPDHMIQGSPDTGLQLSPSHWVVEAGGEPAATER